MLKIEHLNVKVKNNEELILDDFNLNINSGEVHAIMGPNGTGKSTLSKAIMGHYMYDVCDGKIIFLDEDITSLEKAIEEKHSIENVKIMNYILFED